MSLQSWCKRLVRYKNWHWDYAHGLGAWIFIARMRQLVELDDIVLTEKQWDDLMWRANSHGNWILRDTAWERDERIAFMATLARLVRKVRDLTPAHTGGVHMFWEGVLGNYLDRDPAPELRDAFHRVLADQLRLPDKRLQMSALYGLNYLSQADSRVADLVKSLRPQLADDEVLQFADAAVRGDLW